MHPHGSLCFLRGIAQVPLLLHFFDTTVLTQTAIIIVIEDRQGLLHRGIGQQHGFAAGPIVLALPLADHHRIDRMGLEVPPLGMAPMLRRAT